MLIKGIEALGCFHAKAYSPFPLGTGDTIFGVNAFGTTNPPFGDNGTKLNYDDPAQDLPLGDPFLLSLYFLPFFENKRTTYLPNTRPTCQSTNTKRDVVAFLLTHTQTYNNYK